MKGKIVILYLRRKKKLKSRMGTLHVGKLPLFSHFSSSFSCMSSHHLLRHRSPVIGHGLPSPFHLASFSFVNLSSSSNLSLSLTRPHFLSILFLSLKSWAFGCLQSTVTTTNGTTRADRAEVKDAEVAGSTPFTVKRLVGGGGGT